jgi:hypothetical protein
MLEKHPENPTLWFRYAVFLIDHQPGRIEEGRQALEKAIALNDPPRIDSREIEKYREKIRSLR